MAMEDLQNPQTHFYVCSDPNIDQCEICGHRRAEHPIDPRGPGAIQEPGVLERGQPNIIDYSNKEPMLFQAGENSSHDYPGKIITNNEPERGATANDFNQYHDGQTAETGKSQPLNQKTQPGLPTGGPQDTGEIEIDDHAKHGDNFNTKVDFKSDGIEVNDESQEEIPGQSQFPQEGEEESTSSGVAPEEELLYKQILESTASSDDEQTQMTEQLSNESLMHPTGEKSDTGDDLSRTGPEGNNPQENNNATHYTGQLDTKLNVATGIEIEEEHAKQIHDVDGTIPELRDDNKIEIADKYNEAVQDDPNESKSVKKNLLHKIFPSLARLGIISLTLAEFLKLMKDQDYEQIELFDDVETLPKLIPKKFKRFKYNSGSIECPICKPLDGMEFAEDDPTRPITPSEKLGKGIYNTHPNCLCDNIPFEKLLPVLKQPKSDVANSRAAAKSLRERINITKEHLRPLSETLIIKDRIKGEFDWIDEDAINEMKTYATNHGYGKFLLAVLSGESITDHRKDVTVNENKRRRWAKRELMQNIRTAKGKMCDINHMYPKKDPQSGGVYDANWNFTTNRGEVVIWETDQEILDAIRDDTITAVSIHTGLPRRITTNCSDGECFIEPEGTIIGELDNVALAYVVTKPEGFVYNGHHINPLPPGMGFTKIYIVE